MLSNKSRVKEATGFRGVIIGCFDAIGTGPVLNRRESGTVPAVLRYRMSYQSLFSRALDRLDYLTTLARLRVLDWISGPEPLTPADKRRERDAQSIPRARY